MLFPWADAPATRARRSSLSQITGKCSGRSSVCAPGECVEALCFGSGDSSSSRCRVAGVDGGCVRGIGVALILFSDDQASTFLVSDYVDISVPWCLPAPATVETGDPVSVFRSTPTTLPAEQPQSAPSTTAALTVGHLGLRSGRLGLGLGGDVANRTRRGQIVRRGLVPDEPCQQAPHLGHGERDQVADRTRDPPFWADGQEGRRGRTWPVSCVGTPVSCVGTSRRSGGLDTDRVRSSFLPLKKSWQPGVLSVDRIGGHPASRHPGVQRPPQHRDRLDWFGREDDVRWHDRLRATLTVINLRLRQIQLPVQESAPAVSATALGARRRGHAIELMTPEGVLTMSQVLLQAFGPDDLLTRTEDNV